MTHYSLGRYSEKLKELSSTLHMYSPISPYFGVYNLHFHYFGSVSTVFSEEPLVCILLVLQVVHTINCLPALKLKGHWQLSQHSTLLFVNLQRYEINQK